MSSFRTLVLLAGAVALAACGQMTASKDKNAPADSSAAPAATADAGGKPGDAAGGSDSGGAKPAEPTQAPAGTTPDKP
jgi:hypothetical protein